MPGFLDRLRNSLQALNLSRQEILLAVSGGADSVALLYGMHALRNQMQLGLRVAHFNHQLRGEDSFKDAEWLQSLCDWMETPLFIGWEDVRSVAESSGQGLEETARELRYQFLCRTAREQGCTHIAVAHTADDRLETILHHLIRGTGLAGLRGMPQTRRLTDEIVLVRPLLDFTRQEIEEYLAENKQDYREDVTNRNETYTRNRIRHKLLPLLRQEFNPQIDAALLRLAQQAEDVQQTLEILASRLMEQAVKDRSESVYRIDCTLLTDQPRHLIRECFALLWKELNWPRQQMGFTEWDRLAEIVLNGGTATLPGNVEARRRGNLLVLRRVGFVT